MNLINGELPESGLREQFAKLSCVTAPLVRIQYSPPFLGYVGGPGDSVIRRWALTQQEGGA